MENFVNRVKVTITGGEVEKDEYSLQDLDALCPKMSYKQVRKGGGRDAFGCRSRVWREDRMLGVKTKNRTFDSIPYTHTV